MIPVTLTYQHDSGAVFSPSRKYRYRLWRTWSPLLPKLHYLMLNPSTADELKNDPTIERCERRARALGFGGIVILNIFALRATDPRELRKSNDPIGPENNEQITETLSHQTSVVCGWGAHGSLFGRSAQVAEILRRIGIPAMCLGTTKEGEPRHPLYISYKQPLAPWRPQ